MTTMTEARICPPDHAHGAKQTCYNEHKCSCEDCRTSKVDYNYWRLNMKAAGYGPIGLVDAGPARRRIEALMVAGWSIVEIARVAGADPALVRRWRRKARIANESAQKIARAYEALPLRREPATLAERHSVARTIAFARRHGFVAGLAWDDIDAGVLAAPDVAPAPSDAVDVVLVQRAIDGEKPKLTQEERWRAVPVLHARRWSDAYIATWLGVSSQTILRDRQGLDLDGWGEDDVVETPALLRAA